MFGRIIMVENTKWEKNTIFNESLMKKYITKYKKELNLTHSKKEFVLKWIKKLENGELKDEVANYGNFSRIILEGILGYNYGEDIEENVPEEYGRGFSEFAIKKDNKKFMVIELKGTNSDLDKPQNRSDKKTPVDQAFDYAKNSGDINWICVSNYNEFRLYNWRKKEHKYISFKAEELQDPDTFKFFMLVFSKFSTIENNLINKLVDETVLVDRNVESEFYKLYSETRLMLIAELEHIHHHVTREESVHNAQLILNRYIFICFAEDLGLLPEEISIKTIKSVTTLRESEIWHNLNGLFIDVNKGSEFREEKIFGYNGGLFSENLENLKIRDIVEDQSIFDDAYQKWKFEEYTSIVEDQLSHYNKKINPIYKNLMTISSFNFSSELDVNILGHIFENSIGEIEELKADTKGRRKKDGIFYTPEYITDYICRNTIIPYLSKSGKANTVSDLLSEYWGSEIEILEENVRKIKIVDPACGSGAFLNKAGDVLVEIHKAIRERKYIGDKSLMPFFDTIEERRKILLDNIYGVDLNEESVEITKLSLFLKVCKKGLKLPNLDKNIRCGNSLINDPLYTEKPFNWLEEFKEIFKNGGFDVVIGNPPYVRHQEIRSIKPYLKLHYTTYNGLGDLYINFFEKGINILKKGGILSFICSNKFTKVKYGKQLRKFLLRYNIIKYFDYTHFQVFNDATVESCIPIIRKESSNDANIFVNESFFVSQNDISEDSWNFQPPEILNLKNKLYKGALEIKDIPNLEMNIGIMTGFNKAFIIDEKIKNDLLINDPKCEDWIKPLIRGKDIKKWKINYKNLYLLYIPWKFPIAEFKGIKNYLDEFKVDLEKRAVVKENGIPWYALQRYASDYYPEFKKEKIIWQRIAYKPAFCFEDQESLILDSLSFLTIDNPNYNLKYLLSILNSNLFVWFLSQTGHIYGDRGFLVANQYLERFPIVPITLEDQKPFIEIADKMILYNEKLILEINGFKNWLQRPPYNIDKFTKKLNKYYKLSFDDFLIELNKKKVDIKERKTQELFKKEFEESLSKIKPLILEIEKTENEIKNMVYDLYGLNEDEIKIIEKDTNNY